ncbi:nitroreductase family protein [Sinanaerobacter chloroacetimidivorans]|uniref:Nitroreductase family protein n=1 Tax=Sinanaerobacter chloroacetimidivorans TaxID=2818044 RepID=A0A8J7W1L8_9FIRM|nr:nitroreductase family protein [Sinanaerobacter chloroacetimidivorans]MBR0599159.1 nitroreductase family protein [Sinanaerobacter chloroacetimidivorans]
MDLKQAWNQAIISRTSRRSYKNKRISALKVAQIKQLIDMFNMESGLKIQFIDNGHEFLTGYKASYGMFSGTPAVIALVGNSQSEESKRLAGYYGEFLVLECVSLDLGTCWISGTFDKESCRKHIALDQEDELICIIAAGIVRENKSLKERIISQVGKSKQTFNELLKEASDTPPLWVKLGIEAARFAPSAVNGKPIGYRYQDGQISVFIAKENHGNQEIDLGISMAHFQLGALQGLQRGNWIKDSQSYRFQCEF